MAQARLSGESAGSAAERPMEARYRPAAPGSNRWTSFPQLASEKD
jgi:hypothetical protein